MRPPAWLLLVFALAACAGAVPPAPPGATGRPDAGYVTDAGDTADAGDAADAGAADAGSSDAGDADAGAADAGDADGGDAGLPAPVGTVTNPIVFDASTLPAHFADHNDTRTLGAHAIDSYPPVALSELGPEIIYSFLLTQPAKISLTIESAGSAQLQAALLTSLAPATLWTADAGSFSSTQIDNTIGRTLHYFADGKLDPGTQLDPGVYFIAVDSADDASAGAYTLRVKLAMMPNLCTASNTPAPNGVPTEEDHHDGCPPGMIRVPDSPNYCIDQFEGMLVGLDASGKAFPWSPYVNPGTQRIRALSVRSVIPQANMNKYQSAAACAEAGKRLCTYHEWLRACRGTEGLAYPYGNTRDQDINPASPPASWDPQGDACDGARWVHSAVEYFAYFGESGSYVWSHLTHPCIDQMPQSVDPTGWRERCQSQDGVMDMMGNVHEWIDERDVYQASGGTRSVPPGHGAFAGGYYLDTYLNGPGCSYLTTAHTPDQIDESTGFRCCADAK